MPRAEWLTLTDACRLSGLTQNVLYARAARGEVRTRRIGRGRPLEFRREDLERLRAGRATPAAAVVNG